MLNYCFPGVPGVEIRSQLLSKLSDFFDRLNTGDREKLRLFCSGTFFGNLGQNLKLIYECQRPCRSTCWPEGTACRAPTKQRHNRSMRRWTALLFELFL